MVWDLCRSFAAPGRYDDHWNDPAARTAVTPLYGAAIGVDLQPLTPLTEALLFAAEDGPGADLAGFDGAALAELWREIVARVEARTDLLGAAPPGSTPAG